MYICNLMGIFCLRAGEQTIGLGHHASLNSVVDKSAV